MKLECYQLDFSHGVVAIVYPWDVDFSDWNRVANFHRVSHVVAKWKLKRVRLKEVYRWSGENIWKDVGENLSLFEARSLLGMTDINFIF